MTAIWFILAFMTGAAVLALLWPMSRRPKPDEAASAGLATQTRFYEDQLVEIERDLARGLIAPAEAEAARTEAGRRLLRASREEREAEALPVSPSMAEPRLRQRRAASAFALSTIPLVALVVYGLYGSPNLPSQTETDREAAQAGGRDLMKAIGQIEARLASDPGDARGWAVIAPVYMRLGRFDAAARAYEALVHLKGEEPERLGSWGEALVAAGEGSVSPDAKALFERALALDPKAAKPQFYLARADELAGDTAGARRRLEALAAQGPEDAPWMSVVRDGITRLKGESGPTAEAPKSEGKTEGGPAAGPGANIQALPPGERMAAIRGMVEGLDRRLEKQGGSAEEWLRLVRSYHALGQHERAVRVLGRARTALAGDRGALDQLEGGARELGIAAAEAPPDAAKAEAKPPPDQGASDAAAAVRAMPQAERDAMIRGMVTRLDQRLVAKGGSADEWMRLVRSYTALGERERAAAALDRARMALAADAGAVTRLDALGRELDLTVVAAKP